MGSLYDEHYLSNKFTAVTTNTCPQRVFSLVQTGVLVDVNQPLPWFFTRWPREDSFSRFLSTRKNMSAFKPFLQYFAVGSDTASCQDYEEEEFVERNHISFLNRSQLV